MCSLDFVFHSKEIPDKNTIVDGSKIKDKKQKTSTRSSEKKGKQKLPVCP
jgi:hypothetical protein